MIVPSSNVTMEREVPALLREREKVAPERFSFHSSRVRMKSVTPQELQAMNAQAGRACGELADARVDLVAYACLVAVMATGHGAHYATETQLGELLSAEGSQAPVVTSAGALVATLRDIGASRIAILSPYAASLAEKVCGYIGAEDIEVMASNSLGVTDNDAVGRLDPAKLLTLAESLDTTGVDAVVLSACVQMPSLPSIEAAEARLGIPVLSAATATVFQMLRKLRLPTIAPGGGRLLSGFYDMADNSNPLPARAAMGVV